MQRPFGVRQFRSGRLALTLQAGEVGACFRHLFRGLLPDGLQRGLGLRHRSCRGVGAPFGFVALQRPVGGIGTLSDSNPERLELGVRHGDLAFVPGRLVAPLVALFCPLPDLLVDLPHTRLNGRLGRRFGIGLPIVDALVEGLAVPERRPDGGRPFLGLGVGLDELPLQRIHALRANPRFTGVGLQRDGVGEQVVDALPELRQFLDRLAAGTGERAFGGLRPTRFGIFGLAKKCPPAAPDMDAADVGDGETQFALGFELGGLPRAERSTVRFAVGLDICGAGFGEGDLHDDADREFLPGDPEVGFQRSQAFDLRIVRRIEPRCLGAHFPGAPIELLDLGDVLPRFVESRSSSAGFGSGGQIADYATPEVEIAQFVALPRDGGVRLAEPLAFAREFVLERGDLSVQRDGARERVDEAAAAVLVCGQFRPLGFEFLLSQAPPLFGAAAFEFPHARLGFFTPHIEVVEKRVALFAFPFEVFHLPGRLRDGGSVVAYTPEYRRHPRPFILGFAKRFDGSFVVATQSEKLARPLCFVASIRQFLVKARDLLLRRTAFVQLLVHQPLPPRGVFAVLPQLGPWRGTTGFPSAGGGERFVHLVLHGVQHALESRVFGQGLQRLGQALLPGFVGVV